MILMKNTGRFSRIKREAIAMTHQGTGWLAVLAVLVQVLMPFGQALAYDVDSDIEYQVICTATGVKQISIGSDGQPIEPLDVPSSCPFCFLHSAVVLLTPETVPTFSTFIVVAPDAYERPVQQRTAGIWRGAPRPSRAPPLYV